MDFEETARTVIDKNLYLVLGTVDRRGQPHVSPVYFAVADYREFWWVSRPDTAHSRNLAAHPQVSIVIFDSRVPISTAEDTAAVYLSAVAEELSVLGPGERWRAVPLDSRSA